MAASAVNLLPGAREHFWGISAPSFDSLASPALSCYDLFHAASSVAASDCSSYSSETAPLIAQNCAIGASSGILILKRNDSASDLSGAEQLLGTAIYRLRVAGPAGVWMLPPAYCRPDLAAAAYTLPLPGRYSLELFMIYSSFSFVKPAASKALQAPWAAYLTMDVQVPVPAAGATSGGSGDASAAGPTQAPLRARWSSVPHPSVLEPSAAADASSPQGADGDDDAGALPLCNATGPLPGRWRFRAWPLPEAAPLLRTCVFGGELHSEESCNHGERAPLHRSPHPASLYWQPDGCRLRPVSGLSNGADEWRQLQPPPPSPPKQQQHRQHQQKQKAHGQMTVTRRELRLLGNAAQQLQFKQPRKALHLNNPNNLHPQPAHIAAIAANAASMITPERCFPPGRHVCFVGDSHSRYLHNSLVLWLSGNLSRRVDNDRKQVLRSPAASHMRVNWGRSDWPKRDSLAEKHGCTDVVANIGQWAAAYTAGPEPHPAAEYAAAVAHVRSKLLALRRTHGTRVFWVTSCQSSLTAQIDLAGKSWRTDPYMALYNRLASDIMRGGSGGGGRGGGEEAEEEEEEAIPVIDVWSPSYVLSDLTRDATHFANTGAVGRVFLHTVLHALCAEAPYN